MIFNPKTVSSYEEFLSPLDMEYLKNALGKDTLKSKDVRVEITKETDFYTDSQRFIVSWASRLSPNRKQSSAPDLESLC